MNTERKNDGQSNGNDSHGFPQRTCALVPKFSDFNIASYRKSLNLSQVEFAKAYDISLGTLKKWERHSSEPVSNGFKRVIDGWIEKEWLSSAS